MGPAHRRLIVNADDFGRSRSINEAVLRAHREGVLTTASLMVNGEAAAEAVALARQHPRLGVGLHLTLLLGRSTLAAGQVPGLVNANRDFVRGPVAAGVAFFFRRELRAQLRAEIRAQLEWFRQTGLPLDHFNGHLHLHLHPTVLSLLQDLPAGAGLRGVRFTYDPLRLNLRLARGHLAYRLLHALLFALLSRRARPIFLARGWRHTQRVFGLLQNARVDEVYVLRLLEHLPPGDSELYSHPSLDEFRNEFAALVSPRVRALVQQQGIELIRYQDL